MLKFFYNNMNSFIRLPLIFCGLLFVWSCEDDEVDLGDPPIEGAITYRLSEVSSSGINGFIKFYEVDGAVEALIQLAGTESGASYPAHIHGNSAIETGEIEVTFTPVNGSTGESKTTLTNLSMDDIANYDGYVNVHLSESDLSVIAQSDIGSNELTGTTKGYDLALMTEDSVSGTLLLEQRKNGFTKATITLENTVEGGSHPAHIHANTAAEGGGIVISFAPVNGTTGTSVTNIRAFDADAGGEAVTYEQLLEYDGYVNVHLSADQLGTLVSQGDFGQNELNGESLTYELEERAVEGISGNITFEERVNGEILATIALEGTPEGGIHPAHIHQNSYVEAGPIVVSFNPVNGNTGMSKTNITAFDNGDELTLETLGEYNGYVNVHLSAADLGTIVAQGDIGANALTGESVTYMLDERDAEGISGIATLYERNSGNSLLVLDIEGTTEGGSHPAHIHANTAAETGGIVIDLTNVDGATGMSMSTIRQFNDGSSVSYSELLEYDGYINVHFSAADLGTIVAQGDLGQNALTGDSVTYVLNEVADSNVSGTATFYERNNGFSLVEIMVDGTLPLGDHPAHIHFNSAEEGGAIAIDLTNVNGTTGISRTNVDAQNNNKTTTYEDLLGFDGYINVHLSPEVLGTILSQGNIGANVTTEE
ncbi:CHRD domain-containing protein [Catalinimonas niigatensis]|uniref:CHRD domain-containing protein n=1 Tax=Catalinimonas niigatensis TaxID=1397264 RepID=UPI0026669EA2|nr:CHRD domain-containing protein [Catalinimonas niigatensis]WPP51071.1 CHRD domain-containing protein [Catalinimonas niigatensis]